jgi:hypothetical protein
MVRNIIIFYGEELLAPRPTPKLEDHPLSAVRDCLFNVFAATLHTWRPFLHPQPEDAPCRGDRDPLNTVFYTTSDLNDPGLAAYQMSYVWLQCFINYAPLNPVLKKMFA